MSENITQEKMQEIVTNQTVFSHLIKLQKKLQKEFKENIEKYSDEVVEAIQQSPKTNNWIKHNVIPKIYEGNEGLNDVLLEIEEEKNLLLGAAKLQLVIDLLSTMDESLDDIKEGVEEGDYNLEDGLKSFEEQVIFKTLH